MKFYYLEMRPTGITANESDQAENFYQFSANDEDQGCFDVHVFENDTFIQYFSVYGESPGYFVPGKIEEKNHARIAYELAEKEFSLRAKYIPVNSY